MKNKILTIISIIISIVAFSQNNYYVSTTGNNSNNGNLTNPWKTIQFAVNQLKEGDTLNIMAGTYIGKINVLTSGTIKNKITIKNYNNDNVIISGNTLQAYAYLLKIEGVNHITIKGLKFQDYQKLGAIGILVINSSNISILNNDFSNIDYSSTAVGEKPNIKQNSQPIIVFGRDPLKPVSNLKINKNSIYNCETGWSECLSINGNVDGFEVIDNHVYNNTNIPIVAIGHEGECPDPTLDQARNGLIKNNLIHDNPSAYAASGGIYIDGAKSVIIENNITYNNDYGIEVGCENNGKAPNDPSASDITVRNNLVYNNKVAGIALGGYNYPKTGKVETTTITNNTLYNNDTNNSYNGELLISYVENSTIENNIFYTKNLNKVFMVSSSKNKSLSFNHNVYYSPSGSDDIVIELNGKEYNKFSKYKRATSQDLNSIFKDPNFVNTAINKLDLHLTSSSPAINLGNPLFLANQGETDIDKEVRIHNKIIDCGADEYGSVLATKSSNKKN